MELFKEIMCVVIGLLGMIFMIYLIIDVIKSSKRQKELDKLLKEQFEREAEYWNKQMKALEELDKKRIELEKPAKRKVGRPKKNKKEGE